MLTGIAAVLLPRDWVDDEVMVTILIVGFYALGGLAGTDGRKQRWTLRLPSAPSSPQATPLLYQLNSESCPECEKSIPQLERWSEQWGGAIKTTRQGIQVSIVDNLEPTCLSKPPRKGRTVSKKEKIILYTRIHKQFSCNP